jgi:hypothetical protein
MLPPPLLARVSQRLVFMGLLTPFMPAAPPSLTRASRKLVFICVSIPFVPRHLHRWVTSIAGKSELEVGFYRCFDPVRAATTLSLPQLRRGSAGVHALHPIAIFMTFLTSQGCTAVSIDTRTALARFTCHFLYVTRERVYVPLGFIKPLP